MKLKKDAEVDWNGKKKTLLAGVDYKNLPKEITSQLPKARAAKKAG